MTFLLDTNVISEWTRPVPDPGVVQWLSKVNEDDTHLSVVTLAEVRRGIERLPEGARRRRLVAWVDRDLKDRFAGRILGVDAAVADAWGRLVAGRERVGRPIGAMDGFIAATAQVHQLTVVTRNVHDFDLVLDRIVDPWST